MNYVKFIRLTLKHNKCSYGPKNKKLKISFQMYLNVSSKELTHFKGTVQHGKTLVFSKH